MPTGHGFDVSYIVIHKRRRFMFSGHPDFVILEDEFGARQVLISTGEIQSTSDPSDGENDQIPLIQTSDVTLFPLSSSVGSKFQPYCTVLS